jgi:hypothetical protein
MQNQAYTEAFSEERKNVVVAKVLTFYGREEQKRVLDLVVQIVSMS